MLQLSWMKCPKGKWFPLRRVDLERLNAKGVYIIWRSGTPSTVVKVGQGDIAARLAADKADESVLAHEQYGDLFVTWAEVSQSYVEGVDRFLKKVWYALEGDKSGEMPFIEVNSPFD